MPRGVADRRTETAISSYGGEDYFELKGVVELLLEQSGIKYPDFIAGGSDFLHPGRKAEILWRA